MCAIKVGCRSFGFAEASVDKPKHGSADASAESEASVGHYKMTETDSEDFA